MLHIQFIALALTVSALLAAGCGSSSKTGSTTSADAKTSATTSTTTTTAAGPPKISKVIVTAPAGKPLTHAQLIARADAICARRNANIASLTVGSQAAFKRVLPQAAIYDSTESKELNKLVPPASLAHDWSGIINTDQLFSEYVDQVVYYAQTGTRNLSPLIRTTGVVRQQMLAIARRDGFKQCTQ